MSRSRSGSVSGENYRRSRANSQTHIESAISAIQQKESKARETAAATGAFIPGTGGFVGGPPVTASTPDTTDAATGAMLSKGASVRHRRDPSHYIMNGRRVSTKDRICEDVPPPAAFRPTEPQFWSYADPHHPRPSLPFLRTHFQAEGRLTEDQAMYILDATTLILEREPNMIKVGDGVTVCGDVHGQFYDLLKLFDVGGDPTKTPYLFLGDYVDRGAFGIECLLYLYTLKLHYPTTFFLLRGNHECRHLTEFFTFKRECLYKYSPRVYEGCIRSFRALPIAALLDDRFLCVHGGIGPDLKTLADLKEVDRFQEPGMEGILCDILWADPIEDYSRVPDDDEPPIPRVRRYVNGRGKGKGKADYSGDEDEGELLPRGFLHNNVRGCSYHYTYTAVCDFLERNKLLSIIRAHEAQDAGYSMYRSTPLSFPSLITIFSAPNYLDAYHNRAAVIKYVGQHITIRQFNASPHPYSLPGFMDAFTWSLPFVGAKIAEMLLAILNCCTEEELEATDEEDLEEDVERSDMNDEDRMRHREAIKSKVLAVGRMARVFDLLREEAEGVSELTFEVPSEADTPARKLGVHGQRIKKSIHNFEDARKSDILNERIPLSRPSSPWPSPSPPDVDPDSGTEMGPGGGSAPYSNPNRPAPTAYPSPFAHPPSSPHSPSWSSDQGSVQPTSLSPRRRSTTDDTATMIRRALQGGDDDEEDEILRLALKLSKPLIGKDVKRTYVGARTGDANARRIKRMETT